MKQIFVEYHRDGDHLGISNVPFWAVAYSTLADKLYVLLGWGDLPSRLGFKILGHAVEFSDKHSKSLIRLPIDSAYEVSEKLWPNNWHYNPDEDIDENK